MTRLRAALWAIVECVAEIDPWWFLIGYLVAVTVTVAMAVVL